MNRFKNIAVVPAELSLADSGFDRAVALARANEARLTVVWPIEEADGGEGAAEIGRTIVQESEALLDEVLKPLRAGGLAVTSQVLIGRPFIEIIRLVMRDGIDLVIKTARGRRLRTPLLLGTTALHLLRKCPCPLWIVDPDHERGKGALLAAVDTDTDNPGEQALNTKLMELATSLASVEGKELHVVHAWHVPHEDMIRLSPWLRVARSQADGYMTEVEERRRTRFDAVVDRFRKHAPNLTAHFIKGIPEEVISNAARDTGADVIVMATLARGGVPGLLIGNTAEAVLSVADCSVLAVKPEGFVSPIAP